MVQFRVWLQGIFVVLTVVIHVNENEELNIENKNHRAYRTRVEHGVQYWNEDYAY